MKEPLIGVHASVSYPPLWAEGSTRSDARWSAWHAGVRLALNGIMVLGVAALIAVYEMHTTPLASANGFWHGAPIQGRSRGILLVLLCGFFISLFVTSRRSRWYKGWPAGDISCDQRFTLQASLTSCLPISGVLYLVHAADAPHGIALAAAGLVASSLCLRRLIYRMLLRHNFRYDQGTRNVLIVGTGLEQNRFRAYINGCMSLSVTFKNLVDSDGMNSRPVTIWDDVNGTFDTLYAQARTLLVDEILLITPLKRGTLEDVAAQARAHGVGLRVISGKCWGFELDSASEDANNGQERSCTWPSCQWSHRC
jgi:FlaA1/EpsC-like NDP-sugar epimerase